MADLAFGDFRFDPDRLLLYRQEKPTEIGRRAALLLKLLLERRGAVVDRRELIDAAWGGKAIEESNLSVQIASLRRVLGTSPGGGDWISTVARVGYRLAPERSSGGEPAPSLMQLPRLVLLPFDDLRLRPERRLGVVIAEDIVVALGRSRSLAVAALDAAEPTAASTRPRELPAALDARYLLQGSIRDAVGQLRFNVRLVDGTSGQHLWAEVFEAPARSAEESNLAGRIAASVETAIQAAEMTRARRMRTEHLQAYDLYLRGRAKILSSEHSDNAGAFELYSRAIELEPDNVLFLAAAAEALHHRTHAGWRPLTSDDRRLCDQYVRRAFDQPDPDPASISLLGNAQFTSGDPDWGLALTERAAALNPNSVLILGCVALGYLWHGRLEEAERTCQRGLAISPHDPNQRFILGCLAFVAQIRGEYAEALSHAHRAMAISPALGHANWLAIASEHALGRRERAARHAERFMRYTPDVTVGRLQASDSFFSKVMSGPVFDAMERAGVPRR